MIANPGIKLCPFLKKYISEPQDGHYVGNNVYVPNYIEEFRECIKKECTAWNELKKDCRLCDK